MIREDVQRVRIEPPTERPAGARTNTQANTANSWRDNAVRLQIINSITTINCSWSLLTFNGSASVVVFTLFSVCWLTTSVSNATDDGFEDSLVAALPTSAVVTFGFVDDVIGALSEGADSCEFPGEVFCMGMVSGEADGGRHSFATVLADSIWTSSFVGTTLDGESTSGCDVFVAFWVAAQVGVVWESEVEDVAAGADEAAVLSAFDTAGVSFTFNTNTTIFRHRVTYDGGGVHWKTALASLVLSEWVYLREKLTMLPADQIRGSQSTSKKCLNSTPVSMTT